MESFYSLLYRKLLDRRKWTDRQELRVAIVTWIESGPTTVVDAKPASAD